MKPFLSFFIILVFCSSIPKYENVSTNNNLCDYLKTTRQLTKFNFTPKDLYKVDTKGLKKIDLQHLKILFKDNLISSDKDYLYGYFNVTNTRIGLVCYNQTSDCDKPLFFFSLHIIDNCTKVKNHYTILLNDEDIMLNNISSSISKTFDTLTIKSETTSEWLAGSNSTNDTLFTNIYKINLQSSNLDTISKKSYNKKIKYNH